MGSSPRQQAGDQFYQKAQSYQSPYNGQQFMSGINDFYKSGANDLKKSYASDINRNTRATGQRLAGQGVTGGATYEDTIKNANNPIYSRESSALSRLNTSKAGAKVNAMQTVNEDAYKKMMLNLRSIGLLSDTNTWDDVFGGLNAAANVTSAISGIPGI